MEELHEDHAVVSCKVIERAVPNPGALGAEREGIFAHGELERQIVLPEVALETVFRREVEQVLDLPINPLND